MYSGTETPKALKGRLVYDSYRKGMMSISRPDVLHHYRESDLQSMVE